MTALTSLLVLATLFTQVSASLPKTSYFKMVDIWLLFCIIIIFFIIIFHTIIDLHVDYGEHTTKGSWTGSFKKAWDDSASVPGVQVRVRPSSGTGKLLPGEEVTMFPTRRYCSGTKLDLYFYIKFSKIAMLMIFVLFNLAYWGTLATDSGLVYYTYYTRKDN